MQLKNTRIIVCDTSSGTTDILVLDEKTEKYYRSLKDSECFLKQLGYDINYITWMECPGPIQEQFIYMRDDVSPAWND